MTSQNRIWIWNSMARRRRSISDTFEENGLAIIQRHLEDKGHGVRIIDWAVPKGYSSLSNPLLRRLNLFFILFVVLLRKVHLGQKWMGYLSSRLQSMLDQQQEKRMKNALEKMAKQVAMENLPFLGIKVWYGEAFEWAKYLCDCVHRASPETLVIVGGYHASLYEEDLLRYSNFDMGVAEEGEYLLERILKEASHWNGKAWSASEFMASLKESALASLPGLIYRDDGTVRMTPRKRSDGVSEIIPVYSPHSEKTKVHILQDSIGCAWGACHFCVHSKFAPQYWKRQIESILNEIQTVIKQGIGLFRFAGSDIPPRFGERIGRGIIEQGITMEYSMGTRAVRNAHLPDVSAATRDAYVTMIQSGLRGVFMGGETGNDIINDKIMNKGLTSRDIIYTIKAIRAAEEIVGQKITISLAFIFPPPLIDGISFDQVAEDNLSLIKAASPDAAMVTPPGPFKHSEWYNRREEFGFSLPSDFIPVMMAYEYVLYKPLELWPDPPIELQGQAFKDVLRQSQDFKQRVETEADLPTDLSDEHFLMIRAAGLSGKEEISKFKMKSLLSIVSAEYSYLDGICRRVSWYSRQLAEKNRGTV